MMHLKVAKKLLPRPSLVWTPKFRDGDEAPITERRPDLMREWAGKMCEYPEVGRVE